MPKKYSRSCSVSNSGIGLVLATLISFIDHRYGRSGIWRFRPLWLFIVALQIVLFQGSAFGALTQISDHLYRADASSCAGTLTVTWPTFTSSDGHLNVAGRVSVRVTNGILLISLEPGAFYSANYNLVPSGCAPSSEFWNVPVSATPVPLSAVRSINLPTPPTSISLSDITAVDGGVVFGSGTRLGQDTANFSWSSSTLKLSLTNGSIQSASSALILNANTGNDLNLGNSNVLAAVIRIPRNTSDLLFPNLAGSGARCLHVDNTGKVTVAAADCGTGGGGATIQSTTSVIKGDGTGNGIAVTGTGTNCVLVNGSSTACGGSSQWTTSSNDIYNSNVGNVGIGGAPTVAATPAGSLDVFGLARIREDADHNTTGAALYLSTDTNNPYIGYKKSAKNVNFADANQTWMRLNITVGGTGGIESQLVMPAGGGFGFSSSGDASAALGLAFSRTDANTIQINNGATGTLRDLSLRNITISGTCTGCGGGGGSTLPFSSSATSSTLSIVNGTPAVYGFNGISTSVAAGTSTVVRLAGSTSETLLFGIGTDGHLKLIAPTNTFTCTPTGFSGCDTITGSAFTDGIIPLGSVPMASGAGSWTFSTTVTDLRAPLQDNPLTAGTGALVTKSGATRTVSIDTTTVPLKGPFTTLTDAATVTWAIGSAYSANAGLTFTVHSGSRTLNITNPSSGGSYVLWIKQDGTGGEGLTLGTGCTWKVSAGGTGAITPSTAANAIDILAFTYDGTSCYANFAKNFN